VSSNHVKAAAAAANGLAGFLPTAREPTNGDATAAPSPHQLGRSLDHPLGAMSSSDLNEDEHALKRQMLELENQIHHLSRSNAEMKEVLETEGSDPDLRGAIGENIVAIARQLCHAPHCPALHARL